MLSTVWAAPAVLVADQLTLDGGVLEYTGGSVTNVANRRVTLGGNRTFILNGGSGILDFAGSIVGPVSINSGGTLALGSTGIGALTINNSLTLAGGSTNRIELNKANATTSD